MKIIHPNSLSTINNGVYVKISTIENAGYGLFASKNFKRKDYMMVKY